MTDFFAWVAKVPGGRLAIIILVGLVGLQAYLLGQGGLHWRVDDTIVGGIFLLAGFTTISAVGENGGGAFGTLIFIGIALVLFGVAFALLLGYNPYQGLEPRYGIIPFASDSTNATNMTS